MAAVTTVRATAETRAALVALAKEQGRSMVDVLGDAVEAYRRQIFFEQAAAQIAAMRRDRPAEWAALQAEDQAWEATLIDGLEDEPLYDDAADK